METINRSWERKQDVDEILNMIALDFLKPSLEVNCTSLFIWYMIKKGKIKDATKYNIHPEIKATLDKMDNLVETIKAFSNLDMNSIDKKQTHIMNIISIIRDDFMNTALRFMEDPNIFIGFMYGYYFKANIITVMDVISLECGFGSINGAASYGVVVATALRAIDTNAYLDRSKYKLKPLEPELPKPEPHQLTLEELEKRNPNPVKVNVIPSKDTKKEEPEYKDRYITIRGGTGRRADKPTTKIDLLEVINYYKEGFSTEDLSELYDVSAFTLRKKVNDFCANNGIDPVFKRGGKKDTSDNKTVEPVVNNEKSEEDLLFEKAVMVNTQTINKLKNKTYPTIVVPEAPNKQFQNFPVRFSSGSKRMKLVISDEIKEEIDKKGPGFKKLNDGKYYYITSGDYLIFRNEPTPETLEKYRSVKTY